MALNEPCEAGTHRSNPDTEKSLQNTLCERHWRSSQFLSTSGDPILWRNEDTTDVGTVASANHRDVEVNG